MRGAHHSIALVPTMGNLHAGHLSLADLAADVADKVIVTIFVNPTQFGVGEDFAAYPRTLDEDRAQLEECGAVDALFVPAVEEIYPFGVDAAFRVQVPSLGGELCGASRPGHFDGVAGVVLRLLTIASPDILVLGRKDYQQLIILERMIADLRMPVQVVAGATRRHEDGLAISSRNRYLTERERRHAPLLHATLNAIGEELMRGRNSYPELEADAVAALESAGFRPDYVEIRVASDLTRPNGRHSPSDLIVLAAAWLGKARLIDNLRVGA
jgi:pantoate--beta-alanine ligase